MNAKPPILAAACFLTVLLSAAAGRADAPPDLLARMASLNPHLRAFTATMHAHVTMRSFPFLSATLVGTYYYKQPDKNKVVFTSGVPVVAQQFDKLYAHVEPPALWRQLYSVTVVSDNGSVTQFHLVPRKRGNVDHIDATADDRSATVTTMRWSYDNGGYAEMTNRYAHDDGNLVISSQTGHVEEPNYVADITSNLDDYKLNPTLSDDLFASQ
jgi:outer membrane lipoprotein-sorting protein